MDVRWGSGPLADFIMTDMCARGRLLFDMVGVVSEVIVIEIA